MDYGKKALVLHKKLQGKVIVSSKLPLKNKDMLSTLYTPGVGAVSSAIAKDKNEVWKLTGRRNTVAIVSDGTAVLGLGNIGPEAALPVMEGKAMLFSEFGQVNAYPLCIDTKNADDIVSVIKAVTPSVGGINLEDIAAPTCFEIEEKLSGLEIPFFHDDQDGSAIVVLAALINASKLLNRKMRDMKIVIIGAGAAASATAWLMLGREKWHPQKKITNIFFETPKDVVMVDSRGIINERRPDLSRWKRMLAAVTNKENRSGGLEEALKGSDVLIGLSAGGKVTPKQILLMNKNPIVFALANPVPEIMPDVAYKAGAALVATGRSDFANQINNALVFPGLFRGILDTQVSSINSNMKLAAVEAIVKNSTPSKSKLIPGVLERSVHEEIARRIRQAAA